MVTLRRIYKQFGKTPQELLGSPHSYGITVSMHELLPLEIYIRGTGTSNHLLGLPA